MLKVLTRDLPGGFINNIYDKVYEIPRWEQGALICPELISSQSKNPIFPYTIGDWLQMRPGTNVRLLLSFRYTLLTRPITDPYSVKLNYLSTVQAVSR